MKVAVSLTTGCTGDLGWCQQTRREQVELAHRVPNPVSTGTGGQHAARMALSALGQSAAPSIPLGQAFVAPAGTVRE